MKKVAMVAGWVVVVMVLGLLSASFGAATAVGSAPIIEAWRSCLIDHDCSK